MATPSSVTGAEFDENSTPQTVKINRRPRVEKPSVTGNKIADDFDDTPEELAKPTVKSARVDELKPDITEDELKPETKPPETDDSQMVNEFAKKASDTKSAKNLESDPTIDNKISALVENKTYFVPIGQVTKRRNMKIVITVTILLIAATAAAYIVMQG